MLVKIASSLLLAAQVIMTGPRRMVAAPSGGGACTSGACSDSFAGTAGTMLTTPWVEEDVATSPGLHLTGSGTVQMTPNGAGYAEAIYQNSTSDTSQVTIVPPSLNGDLERGPCVRMQATGAYTSDNGYCVMVLVSGGYGSTVRFYKQFVGVTTATIGTPLDMSISHTVKIVASGTSTVTVSAYCDGTLVGSYTDSSSPLGSGHPGFQDNATNGETVSQTTISSWQDH